MTTSTVPEILRGKRGIGRKHIDAFARYFHVSPAAFLPKPWNETVSLVPLREPAPPGRLVDCPSGAFLSLPPSQPLPEEHAPRKASVPAISRIRFTRTV